MWDDLVALLKKEGCLTESPPQPKGYSYYMGRRRKEAKKGTAYLVGDAAGLATVEFAEGIAPAVESGLLAARDVCGKGTYSLRSISSYSLPFMDRASSYASRGWRPDFRNSAMRNLLCVGILAAAAVPAAAQDVNLTQILLPGEGWQEVAAEWKSAAGLAGDGRGNVYVADGKQIWRIDKDGKASVFAKTDGVVHGLAVGPDGKIFASEPERKVVLLLDANGKEVGKSEGDSVRDLVVTKQGMIYATLADGNGVTSSTRARNVRSPKASLRRELWPYGPTTVRWSSATAATSTSTLSASRRTVHCMRRIAIIRCGCVRAAERQRGLQRWTR